MPARSGSGRAIARHAIRQERVRLTVIGSICALYAVAIVVGYRDAYPTTAERERFATAFRDNIALRLFYGVPHDLASVAGYAEFRVVGILPIVASAWAVFAAVRPLRGEEDDGCYELILAGATTRVRALAAVLTALAAECAVVALATAAGFLVSGTAFGDVTATQAALLTGAVAAPAALFAAVGALTSQLAATRRSAQAIGAGALGVAVLLRIIADVSRGEAWLRWLTPMGWSEQVHPVTGPRPAVLGLFAAAAVAVGCAAFWLTRRRDIGTGLIAVRAPRSRIALLDSTTQAAVRSELPSFLGWLAGVGTFVFVLGLFARSVSDEARTAGMGSLGLNLTTAVGYLSTAFVLFVLLVALFAASHVSGIRDEEASGRLETLLALPVARRSWLAGRLAVGAGATVVLSLLLGLLAWIGTVLTGAGVGFAGLLAAGANCIPAALLFLGLGGLLFALLPRFSPGAALGLVGVAFLWELVGALVSAPSWLLAVSPFHHVTAVPNVHLDRAGAVGMLIIAAAAAAAGVEVFARRDLRTG